MHGQDMKKFGVPEKMKQRCILKKKKTCQLLKEKQSMEEKIITVDSRLDGENRPAKRRHA